MEQYFTLSNIRVFFGRRRGTCFTIGLPAKQKMHCKAIHILFFLFLLLPNTSTQCSTITEKVDSLKRLLETSKEDTWKVNILNSIAYELRSNSPDTAMLFAKQAFQLAEKNGFKKGIAVSYNNIAIVYYAQGNYSNALNFHFKSLKIYESLGDKEGIANSYNNIAMVYDVQGNYSNALNFYLKALKIRESLEDKKDIADSYNNIAIVYYAQGNYSNALNFYLKALKIFESLGDKKGITNSYNNIAMVYNAQGNYSNALNFYLKSLKIKESLEDKKGIANSYNNIAGVYYAQGNYSNALNFYFKSLKIYETLEDKKGIAISYNNIAGVYYEQGNYSNALNFYLKSLKIFESLGDKKGIIASYINISDLLIILGSDTINNQSLSQKADSLMGQYLPEDTSTFKTLILPGRNGLYHQALSLLLKSVNIAEEIRDKKALTYSLPSIGKLYIVIDKVSESIPYYVRSIEIAKEIGSKPTLSSSYLGISEAWLQLSTQTKNLAKKVGYLNNAFSALQSHLKLKDTLFNEQSIKSINEMQTKYETEKKEKEIKLLTKDKQIQQSLNKQQQTELKWRNLLLYGSGLILCLSVLLIFILFNRYRLKQRSNYQLQKKNEEISHQKELLFEEKTKLDTANKNLGQAYTQLKELETFKESIMGMIVHDLKNPLNVVIGLSDGDTAQKMKLIFNAGNQMLNLVLNILDIQKFQTTQVKLKLNNKQLKGVIKSALEQVSFISQRKNILIDDLTDKKWLVSIDDKLIERVLVNLLNNSVNYTPVGGEIKIGIKTHNNNGFVEVSVRDSGIGMNPESLKKVFDKFYGDETKKTNFNYSTGLGLTFCKLAVGAHGGKIWAESQEGQGSTFYFTLPLARKMNFK